MRSSSILFPLLPIALTTATGVATAQAQQGLATRAVAVQPLLVRGAADTVLSLPVQRPPVFTGQVVSLTADTLVLNAPDAAGTPMAPAWATNRFVYDAAAGQRETYFLEIITGALAGSHYTIVQSGADTVRLGVEGDDLTNHPQLGAVKVGDRVRIRPYWRVQDVFEVSGIPLIESRPNAFVVRDDILIPNYSYSTVATNKAARLIIHHVKNVGWRAAGQDKVDYADQILPPHQTFTVRRRNPADVTLWNTGALTTVRSVAFVAGGNGTLANDWPVALNHPVPVTLDDSGLRTADPATSVIRESTSDFMRGDELLAYPPGQVFNPAASIIYYYRAGEGWKQVGSPGVIGSTVKLEPGTGYIIRKKADSPGTDWITQPTR